MNRRVNAVSVICEDIRQETRGTETLVGILPDNAAIPSIPFTFPKICVYTRISIPVDLETGAINVIVEWDGEEINKTEIDGGLVQKAIDDSKSMSNPIANIISRTSTTFFSVQKSGRILIWVQIGDDRFVTATLNISKS